MLRFSRRPVLLIATIFGGSALLQGCPEASEPTSSPVLPTEVSKAKDRPGSIGELEALRKDKARKSAARILNPSGAKAYAGPVGSLTGIVRVIGDAAPSSNADLKNIPQDGCERAFGMYRKLFRKGAAGSLGDALVAVTGYEGFLPPHSDSVPVKIQGCAWSTRTVAMTVGQHLEIINLDSKPYMPRLAGSPTPALRVVMAGGAPVPLFAPRAGAYQLVAETRPYMKADVFVVAYPTTAVTELDGKFEVRGLPPGEMTVTAFSPAIGVRQQVSQRVKIEAGKATTVELTVTFSASDYARQQGNGLTP